MAQETTNNPRNVSTMTAKKSAEKLPSSTEPTDNSFVLSDEDSCINNIRRSEKRMLKKHGDNLSKLHKDY